MASASVNLVLEFICFQFQEFFPAEKDITALKMASF